jgi:hypothetical protein
VQVFFVPDKAMPGWSVVLLKEARGRRITSDGVEQSLGQEESSADRDVFAAMDEERLEGEDKNVHVDATEPRRRERRRRIM